MIHFAALASSLLFASSMTLTFADTAFAGFDGTEIASAGDAIDSGADEADSSIDHGADLET